MRPSHRQRIHHEIRARILSGAIGPQDRLVDHALAAELGTSRMPVREALMQLVSEGYLASTTRGFALPDLSALQIAEVFTLRKLLEPHAAALAAQTMLPPTLELLAAALQALEAAETQAAFHRAAETFRNAWTSALPNAELAQAIQRYAPQVQKVRLLTMGEPQARAQVVLGLRALTQAFAAKDGLRAADLMTRFIHQAEESHQRATR